MSWPGQRVLVIGGAGFIGSHVVDVLLAREVGQVVIYDDFTRGRRKNLDAGLRDPRVSSTRPPSGSCTATSTHVSPST